MKPLTLEKAFNIAFFEKDSFENFIKFKPSSEIKFSLRNERLIAEPSSKLKDYHKFINEFIFSYLKVNKDVVFSYRKGASTYEAVKLHANSRVFFNTDIKSFFPSINREYARWVLNENISAIPITDFSSFIEKILDFIIVDDALPVGFPTSPSFSNACLYNFDVELQEYCLNKGYVYSRYSDDIIISSEKDLEENIYSTVCGLLSDVAGINFSLNSKKTKLIKKGNKIKLLGMVILPTGIVTVDIKIKKKVEHLIYFYLNDKDRFLDAVRNEHGNRNKNLNNSEALDRGVSMVSGLLNHVNTVDKSYLDKLRKKYGNTIVDLFFHKNLNLS